MSLRWLRFALLLYAAFGSLLLLTSIAAAQNFYPLPNNYPNGSFFACGVPVVGNPCSNPVNIYPTSALGTPINQPAQIGASGTFGFWVQSSQPQITIELLPPYASSFVATLGGGSTGGTGGAFISVTSPPYNADSSGTTDSSTGFNNALAACAGGTVLIPAGTYKLAAEVDIVNACTLYAYPGTATLNKAYNSANGLPGNSGSLQVKASNVMLYGFTYDGGNGSAFTGSCINFSTNGASTISNVGVKEVTIRNCESNPLAFSSSASYTTNGPTQYYVLRSTITCVNSVNAKGAIVIQGTVTNGNIGDNNLYCDQTSYGSGPGTVEVESQGLTTRISDLNIHDNYMTCADSGNTATVTGWCVQAGGFNALTMTGLVVHNNVMDLLHTTKAGFVSVQATFGAVISGNTFNCNANAINYTVVEMIYDSGTQTTGNAINCDNSSTNADITCNMCNGSLVANNTLLGFGEQGDQSNVAAGIAIESTHASQAIGTSLVEATNTVTVTIGSALTSFWQPGTTVCISGATTAGYNICGRILDGTYSRTGGTFTMYNPVSALASCSGACVAAAFVQADNNNNIFTGNTITLPCAGTLSGGRYGILARVTGANELGSNNRVNGNTIIGCGLGNGTGTDTGIRFANAGVATVSMDSNRIHDNTLVNLATGIRLDSATAGTTYYIKGNIYTNVTTKVTFTGTTNVFAQIDFPVTFGTLVTCAANFYGGQAFITDNNSALTFGTTATGAGAGKSRVTCGQNNTWTTDGT